MSNKSKKTKKATADEIQEPTVGTEEAENETSMVDELTQANLRITELEAELAAANIQVEGQKDSVIRAAAEVDNVRRRTAKDIENAHKFALEKFINELLPIIDNLERALLGSENNEDETTKAVYQGVELTLKSFIAAIEKFGLSQVNPQGKAFNPDHHQAIGMQPSDEFAANIVMMVMQKGYLLNNRLLRPAMVMVSKGADEPVKPADTDDR